MADIVVNNTNPNPAMTDMFNDGEPSIAINPSNTNEIVISAFSGSWDRTRRSGTGLTEKYLTKHHCTGAAGTAAAGCLDQAFDYDRGTASPALFCWYFQRDDH